MYIVYIDVKATPAGNVSAKYTRSIPTSTVTFILHLAFLIKRRYIMYNNVRCVCICALLQKLTAGEIIGADNEREEIDREKNAVKNIL